MSVLSPGSAPQHTDLQAAFAASSSSPSCSSSSTPTTASSSTTTTTTAAAAPATAVSRQRRSAPPLPKNRCGETPLHVASRCGHAHVVETLCARDGWRYVNARDRHGETALHGAVWNDFVGVASILIRFGAAVNLVNAEGESALSMAAARGHLDCVQVNHSENVGERWGSSNMVQN